MSWHKAFILVPSAAVFLVVGCASYQNMFADTELIQFSIRTESQKVARGEEFTITLEISNSSDTPIRFCADPGSFHFRGNGEIRSSPFSISGHPSCKDLQVVEAGSSYRWQTIGGKAGSNGRSPFEKLVRRDDLVVPQVTRHGDDRMFLTFHLGGEDRDIEVGVAELGKIPGAQIVMPGVVLVDEMTVAVEVEELG